MSQPGADPVSMMRSRAYLRLLVLAAVLGVPVSAGAYWFLKLTELVQGWTFTDVPKAVGFDAEPVWWPVVPLTVAGVAVGLVIRYLPGRGGHSPADGFHAGGVPVPNTLPGVALAALASIGLGAVVGPEGPLVVLGGGLAYLAVTLIQRDVPAQGAAVIAATGSFAAISTLLGTPLAGAFLLMEASGLGGPLATAVLLPGLVASGVGALVFIGFDALTGYGTFSLAIQGLPAMPTPNGAELGYAVAVAVAAAPLCLLIRSAALRLRPLVEQHLVVLTPVVGLAIAGLAIGYAEATGHSTTDVLFSGQAELPGLVAHRAAYTVGALLLLLACKGLAYSAALSSFRGGPIFPAMFLGAAGGVALAHLPGMDLVAGLAIGMAAMTAGMLRLPLSAVLLTTLLLGADGYNAVPLSIVAATVTYLLVQRDLPAAGTEVPPAAADAMPAQRSDTSASTASRTP